MCLMKEDLNVHVPFHSVTKVRVRKWDFVQSAAGLSSTSSLNTNQSFLHEGCDVCFLLKLLNRGVDSAVSYTQVFRLFRLPLLIQVGWTK